MYLCMIFSLLDYAFVVVGKTVRAALSEKQTVPSRDPLLAHGLIYSCLPAMARTFLKKSVMPIMPIFCAKKLGTEDPT